MSTVTRSPSEGSYTISEAVKVTGRSRPTIRRYLDAGRFPNAFRAPSETGNEPWKIPARDLRAAGMTLQGDTAPTTSDTGQASIDDLQTRLAVAEALADERRQTIELLTAQLSSLQETLRVALGR